jgi:hypothetical protein
MDWSHPVDIYCERTDPAFWAEPVNALSNAAFLIAAIVAYAQWRRTSERDWPVAALVALVATIGVGSFIFHTVATRGASLFDTVPIAVFIYAYLFFALRRFLGVSLIAAAVLLIAFVALSAVEGMLMPARALNGSHAYLPALAATLVVGWLVRRQPAGPYVLAAGGTLIVSLVFRTIDNAVCPAFPLGTHFVWHLLNAAVLYLLLRASLTGRMPAGKAGALPLN